MDLMVRDDKPSAYARPGGINEYKEWLTGYINNGGKYTHKYNYPFCQGMDKFFVMKRDFRISPLFGVNSVSLLVPLGVCFLGGELGHNNIYCIDNFSVLGGFVPVYTDVGSGEDNIGDHQ